MGLRVIRFDNLLVGVAAAAFVVSLSASALSNESWFLVVGISLMTGMFAAALRSRRGISLKRNFATAAATAGSASLILTAAFVAAFLVSRENAYLEAHLFDRAVPWWIGAAFMILCIASVFGIAALIGHLVIGRLSSGRQGTSTRILLLLLLSMMLACDRSPGAEEVTENLELLGTRPSPRDTLEVHLVNRLRQLLDAVEAADSAAIGTLITADFKAIDMRVTKSNRSLVTPTRAEELTYWQVLAGSLSDRLAEEYRAFDASADGNTATVYASGVAHNLWSAWLYRNAAWHAASVTIVPLPAVQPSVAGKSPIDRAR